MAPAKSRYAPSGQTVATGRGLYIRRVKSEYSFPLVFSPSVILSVLPLEQNRILGYTDLGEVEEAAPPTSDGSKPNLSSVFPVWKPNGKEGGWVGQPKGITTRWSSGGWA